MSNPRATWVVELNVECPACHELVDLLEYSDFWDGKKLQPAEPREGQEEVCPKCFETIIVDFVY